MFCLSGDDGIVHYHFLTDAEDELIKIRSYYDAVGSRTEEVILHRTYSHYNNYLHIETSTQKPLVSSQQDVEFCTGMFKTRNQLISELLC